MSSVRVSTRMGATRSRRRPAVRCLALLIFCVLAIRANCANAQFFGDAQQDVVSVYLFNGQDEAAHRKQMEQRAQVRLSQIAAIVGLEDEKQEKVRLAIRGDLNRFYRCVAAIREKTKGLDIQKNEDMQKAWQEIMPLQQQLTKGLLEQDSLFEKVLEASLSDDQNTVYRKELADRKMAKQQAILRMTIADLELSIPLLARQRTALLEELMKIKQPRTIPDGYGPYLGAIMCTKLDVAVLGKFLDESQLKAFSKYNVQGKAYAQAVTW